MRVKHNGERKDQRWRVTGSKGDDVGCNGLKVIPNKLARKAGTSES